jgi:hypothetical protein
MSLSDVVSALDASIWQQIALLIFTAAFVAIVVQALTRRRAEIERCARLPIDDQPAGRCAATCDERRGVES